MPADSLTLAVTSGFGVGIIAGIVSGVCYVFIHGFVGKRPRNSKGQWHCGVCGVQFRSIEGVLDTERVVTCIKCGGKICKIRCSNQDPQIGWICQSCQHPESWFKGILKALHPNSIRGASKTKMNPDRIDEIDEDLEALKKKEKEHVRDFIERLVEAMLGSSIDNASITRIYNDKKYLPIIGQSPCSAHASLKLLIQRIIQESIGLPTFTQAEIHPGAPAEDGNRTYEDLLATAILNKVIQNYQDEPISSGNSVSSRLSNSSRQHDKEYFFGEETLNTKWKNGNSAAGDVDTTSVSSLDEWVRSDSSVGSTKFIDHMSLTIQQRIEEVSSTDDEADIEPVPKNTLDVESEEWQENWKMQKRKFGGSASPVPVPMLVPNPTTEAKVLIGDRDAEDTTDLSDAGSEFGDTETVQAIESILVDSKTVIGGKNILVNVNVENENISEDGSTDTSDMIEEKERVFETLTSITSNEQDADLIEISETINSAVVDQADYEDTSPISLGSHTEQDTEYTEKYATLPRTILKSPTPVLRDLKTAMDSFVQNDTEIPPSTDIDSVEKAQTTALKQNGHHELGVSTEDDDYDQSEKFKGSYSEREKLKWNNAVEMKNNPYSPENLNRRLSSRSSDSSNASMFGRDYYIKEAAKSAGARKKLPNTTQDEVDYQTTKMEDKIYKEPTNEFATPTTLDTSIFKAIPAIVDTDSSLQTDESLIEVASPIRRNMLDISSDSDLSIERVYNLHSGKVYEKVGEANREIGAGNKSPECIKYTPNLEFDQNVEVDENHNNRTTNDRKRDFLRSLTQTEDDYLPTEHSSSQISSPVDDIFNEHIETPVNQSNNTNNVPLIINNAFITAIQDDDSGNTEIDSPDYSILSSSNETSLKSKEFSLEYSTDGYDGNISLAQDSLNVTADPEIVDLQDKHLVKDKLGLFSKSYPNLAAIPLRNKSSKQEQVSNRQSQSQELLDQSVNDLRRKFDYDEELNTNLQEPPKNKQVHSLTARSIPREFRQELKGNGFEIEAELQNNSTATPNDGNEADEPEIFPTAKSRIQFFENLRR